MVLTEQGHKEVIEAMEEAVIAGVSPREAVDICCAGKAGPGMITRRRLWELGRRCAGCICEPAVWRCAMKAAVKAQLIGNLKVLKLCSVLSNPGSQWCQARERKEYHTGFLLNLSAPEVAMKKKSKNPMARQRALNGWILGNGNLWTEERSLLVGRPGKPFFREVKDKRRNTLRFRKK